jgi:Tol biopolymer transport system component
VVAAGLFAVATLGNAQLHVEHLESAALGSNDGAADNLVFPGPAGSALSADGRYLVFESSAGNLVAGGGGGVFQIYLVDRHSGQTTLISRAPGGAPGNANSLDPVISADGRRIAYVSRASNLVPGDGNGQTISDVMWFDRDSGTTALASVSSAGAQSTVDHSASAGLSADGRYVVFQSRSPNLVAGDSNGVTDVFVRDTLSNTTERVSLDNAGAQVTGGNGSGPGYLSDDGRYVLFL